MDRIEILKIEWKNFLSYGNQWTSYDFKKGVTLIKGYDKEKNRSNGSGKSSFLEVLVFGLFGVTIKDIKKKGIPNWINKKGCEVRVEFRRGINKYKIVRGIKPNKLIFYINDVEQPNLSKVTEHQKMIEDDYLGMDFKTFRNLVYSNPNNTISLFDTPKGEKRQFLEKLFDLGLFSDMNKLINEKLQRIVTSIMNDSNEMESNSKVITVLNGDVTTFENNLNDITLYDDSEINKLEKEVDEIVERGIYNKDVETKRKELIELGSDKNKIKVSFDEVDKSVISKEKDVESVQKDIDRIDVTGSKTALEAKEKKYNALVEAGLPSRKKNNITKSMEIKSNIDKVDADIVKAIQNIASNKGELKAFPDPEKVKGKHKCPTCYQDVDYEHIKEEIEKIKAPLEKSIEEDSARLTELKETKAGLDKDLEDVEDKIRTIDEYIRESEQLEVDIDRIKSELENDEEELDTAEKLKETLTQKLTEAKKTLIPLADELKKVTDEYEELSQDIKDIEQDKSVYDFNTSRLESIKEANDKAEKQRKQIQSQLDKKIKERDILQEKNNKLEKGLKKSNTMKDYLSYLKDSLKDENVKQYAISSMIPFINRQTNHYLSETGHSFYVNIDGWLDAEIKGPGVSNCEYGNLSGGESKSIDLAMQFSCNDVANLQSVAACDILFLDEILDSSIDAQGLEQLVDIVQLKQKDNDLKVFVISHREEVNDIVFDNEILVEKDNGFSNLKEI